MSRAALLLGAPLLASACGPSKFDTIVVDISPNCNIVAIDVEQTDLRAPDGEWVAVLQAASDGPGTRGWWLLVHAVEAGADTLALAHLQDGKVDASVPLNLPLAARHVVDLRPGPNSGEAWVVHETPEDLRLWQVDVHVTPPLRAASVNFAAFPTNTDNTCLDDPDCEPASWYRDLAFLAGQPTLVSIPPSTPKEETYVYVARPDPALTWFNTNELEFPPQDCDTSLDPEELDACQTKKMELSHPSIEVLGGQLDARPARARYLLLRTTAESGVPQLEPEVVVLSLHLDDSNIAQGNAQAAKPQDVRAIVGPPSGVVVDQSSAYALHATAADGPRLFRVPDIGASFERIEGIELTEDTEVLQLDNDIALSRIVDGRWVITKLFPDAPEQSRITEHEAATAITDVDPAGPGSFLVHREDGGPDLVHVRCTDPFSPPDEG